MVLPSKFPPRLAIGSREQRRGEGEYAAACGLAIRKPAEVPAHYPMLLKQAAKKKSPGAGSAEARTHYTERTTYPDRTQLGICSMPSHLWQFFDGSYVNLLL